MALTLEARNGHGRRCASALLSGAQARRADGGPLGEPFVDHLAEYCATVKPAPILPGRHILDALLGMLANGSLHVPIAETLPPSDFRRPQELSQTGHVRGKIVLTLR